MKRKFLFMALIITVFISCSKEESSISMQEETIDLAFNYELYEDKTSLFETLKRIDFNNEDNRNNNISDFEEAISIINNNYGTDLYPTQLDLFQMENQNAGLEYISQIGYLDAQEYNIINSFFVDLIDYDFNQSITRLENRILALNLEQEEFDKYNFLVNTLMITNDYYLSQGVDIFTEIGNSRISGSCAVAIAANAVSTYGLTSCIVPGPNCWAAILGKGLSLLGMFLSCGNDVQL